MVTNNPKYIIQHILTWWKYVNKLYKQLCFTATNLFLCQDSFRSMANTAILTLVSYFIKSFLIDLLLF